jgi:hypothetical protein
MKTLNCDNCNTAFNVHDDCDVVQCPGCRIMVHAKAGTPPLGTEPGDSDREDYRRLAGQKS